MKYLVMHFFPKNHCKSVRIVLKWVIVIRVCRLCIQYGFKKSDWISKGSGLAEVIFDV